MATYVRPQVLVFQEFRAVPTAITDALRAHVSGPHGRLHRHAEADEKALIGLGEYDPVSDAAFDWPDKAAGSLVDLDYTKLYIDNALLRYFRDLVGQGGTVVPVANYPNRVRSSSVSFKTNGDYERSAALLRDVAPGDTVLIRGSDGGDEYTLTTYVRGFVGEPVAATVGAAAAASTNNASQSAAAYIDKIGGADNNVTLTVSAAAFSALATGNIDETYTIEVTSGSVGGDLTSARLRITSASGNDDVASVAPAGVGGFFDIGTQGLLGEFDVNATASGSSAAAEDDAAPNDLVAGQKWRVRAKMAYTAPTVASSGTYTGPWDTTYIAEVTTGGGYGNGPKITVTTTTGVDVSGPTEVTASGVAVALGSEGARLTFTGGTGLVKGDKWEVTVTAEAEGAMQTLVLGHNLPVEIQDAADVDLSLFIKKNLRVEENRTGFAPQVNWEATATEFTVKSGILAYDDSWVDDAGDQVALDVVGGAMYLEYREWLSDYTGVVESLDDAALVAETLGTLHPDNPLGWGVYKALSNSGGVPVRFTAVTDPADTESWAEVLALLNGRDDVYSLVPLTHSRTVQDLFAAHVASQSSAEAGLWRAAFVNLKAVPTKAIADASLSDDEAVILATLADDPATSGTQYTRLEVTSGNAALEEMGVRAGDVVRYLFTTDGFGATEYSEFVIESVENETTLLLATGHTVAVTTPQKVEVWRNLSKTQLAADLAAAAGSFASSRVCAVWPDTVSAGGVEMEGYFLCAALAGLRSGVVPHQGLTNVQITGFDDISRTTDFFNNTQLDTLAGSGTWVVTQDNDGTVFSRHAVTTDNTDVNTREEMVRANVDSMSYVFLRNLKPFIGRANVTPSALTVIRVQLEASIEYLKANGFTESLGGQLIDGEITQLRAHALLRDRVVASVTLTVPYPLNNVELHLVV